MEFLDEFDGEQLPGHAQIGRYMVLTYNSTEKGWHTGVYSQPVKLTPVPGRGYHARYPTRDLAIEGHQLVVEAVRRQVLEEARNR
jgi:hypothetical protein